MGLRLHGRRALVTGASGGIGSAIARGLHRRGARLVLTGRRADALDALAAELGPGIETLVADLAEPAAAGELAERAGAVDVLVANAALPASGALDSFSPAEIDRAVDVNLRAPMQLARSLADGMVERGAGHLVFVSSFSGKVATAGSCVYSAAKFGIRGFALGAREDLRGTGVGVTTIFPGFVSASGMFADAGVKLPRGVAMRTSDQVADAVVKGIEGDRAEVDVAPITLRAGAWAAGVTPALVAAINRRLGSERVASALAEAQRGRR
ncbi:MAG TPA: SDR family NAD(P)-dependent oxidoreductase [Thermoleophilaceae bacterium]|nr:SDR family NAD(P)-dependent oxidoreductase [Thermoleophilaceae bacterium]